MNYTKLFSLHLEKSIADYFSEITPTITGIILTALIIIVMSLVYNSKIKKYGPEDEPKGFVLLVEMFVEPIQNLVVEVMGPKYKKLTPYFLYIALYIVIGGLLSIMGFDSPVSSITVTLSMSFITFMGIYYFGIKFSKFKFIAAKLLNPMEWIAQFAPLISLAFRLFGNILGGGVIMALLYWLTNGTSGYITKLGGFKNDGDLIMTPSVDFLSPLFAFVLHMYFDMFGPAIQSLIFTMLTLVYWKLEIPDDIETTREDETIEKKKSLFKKEKNTINIKTS